MYVAEESKSQTGLSSSPPEFTFVLMNVAVPIKN